MAVQIKKFYEYVIYIITILNLEFLNVFQNLNTVSVNISVVLSVFLFFVYVLQFNRFSLKNNTVVVIVVSIVILLIIELFRDVNTSFIFYQSLEDKIGNIKTFSYLLLTFPIYEIISSSQNNNFLKNIYFLGLLALVVRIIVWFFYNKFNITLMPGLFEVMGYSWSHGNGTRLSGTFLDGYLISYTLTKITRINKSGIKELGEYIFNLAIILFYSFWVYNSRTQIICYILTIFFSLLFVQNKIISNCFKLVFAVVVIRLIINVSNISNFLSSYVNTTTDAGVQVRNIGLQFYQSEWINHKLLGFGIVPDANSFHTWYNTWAYYLSDLGIITNLFEFGIIGFFVLIWPLMYALVQGIKHVETFNGYFVTLLSFFTLASSFALQNVYMWSKILIIPFILALVAVIKQKSIK